MSTEAAESHENTSSPGTGIPKTVAESLSKMTESIKTLAVAIRTIRSDVHDLKRKAPQAEDVSTEETAHKKRLSDGGNETAIPSTSGSQCKQTARASPLIPSTSKSHSKEGVISDDDEEDINEFLEEENNEDSSENEHFDMMADLEIFFEGQETTGPVVQERIARVTERALRGEITNKEDEKMQTLKEKHRRPANIANMQIPKIDPFMWRHLKAETRAGDFIQVKALENYSYILTPLIKALDLFKSNSDQDKAIEYVSDAYKFTGLMVKATNNARLEKVKKELHPDYKTICDAKKMTATLLLGDTTSEEIRKVKEGSRNTPFESPFLGRRGGPRPQRRFFRGASRYPAHYNTSRNPSYNKYKRNQNWGFNKKKSNFQRKK